MTIYTLYVKRHRKTGLKYLGQTSKDPFEYRGSGKDWLPHLKEFGDDVYTEIILQTTDKEERNRQGRHYSNLWHVVTAVDDFGNKIWANRIPETGGGSSPSPETREILRQSQIGRSKPPRTKEHSANLSKSSKGIKKPRTKEHQAAWTESSKKNWANNHDRKKQVSDLGKSNKGRKQSKETLERKSAKMKEYWAKKKTPSF